MLLVICQLSRDVIGYEDSYALLPNGQRQRELEKKLKRKTTILHVQHTFWYISLLSVHDHLVKFPHATFCEAAPPARHFFFLFLPKLG